METMEAVEIDLGAEPVEQEETELNTEQESGEQEQDPAQQRRLADREYEKFIKGLKEDGDASKHYRRIKDDYGRLQAIHKLDPKGIDGIRSHYDTVNGIAHGDKTGIEAVHSIQEALAESQAAMEAIASGDMESLSDDQREGVLRMAPAMIDHLAESNPDAYAALMLPHFMEALKSSELVGSFNGLVDMLNEQPPSWLTKEQVGQWTLDRLTRMGQLVGNMGKWFGAQEAKVKEFSNGTRRDERGRFGGQQNTEKTQGPAANPDFWKNSVYPETNKFAEETFTKELRPWAEKLAKAGIRLSDAKKQSLAQEMVSAVSALAAKNPSYAGQMKRFNSMRSPDAASVLSTFRNEFGRHAKTVLDGLIKRDYDQVLNKPARQVARTPSTTKTATPETGVKVVSMKPSRDTIDFQKTPTDWIYKDKYRLKNGQVVQYQK